jgi:hypothetical protein
MKKIVLQGLLVALLFSCNNNSSSNQSSTDATAVSEQAAPPASGAALSSRLRDIGMNTESDWRGVNIGDPVATVRKNEKATLFENDAKHLGYTIEFPNLESIDFQYHLTSQQTVQGIEVDLYLNDLQSVDAYQTDLKRYFDARYKPSGTAGSWVGDKQQTITLQNVSKGKDYGLKFKISGAQAA